MPTYPTSRRADFLLWCQAQAPVWQAHAQAIGLDDERTAAYAAAAQQAEASLIAQEQASAAARMATEQARADLAALRQLTGENVRTIRSFAESSEDPNEVLQLAKLPPIAKRSPAPPPDQPRNLGVMIDPSTGALTIHWKAANPRNASGTTYIIRRRLPGEPSFTVIGITGAKQFIDDTLPAGLANVAYTVQGTRSGINGPLSDILTVNFGTESGGSAKAGRSAPDSTALAA